MTDKTQRDIQRGERAKQILADELMVEARAHIDAELWRLFKETNPQDLETLKHIKGMEYFHEKYLAFFQRVINDGKVAKVNLEEKKKRTLKQRVFGDQFG